MSLPDVGLLAVLLITHSRPGPKLVFHCPLRPQSQSRRLPSSTDGEDHRRLDDPNNARDHAATPRFQPPDENRSKFQRSAVSGNPDSGQLFGISTETLEKLLFPGRWCDRKKFEISIGDITFISRPVYAEDSGKWNRGEQGLEQEASHNGRPRTPPADISNTVDRDTEVQSGITIIEPTPTKTKHDFTHVPESLPSQSGLSLGTSMNSESTASASISPETLTAFNVVLAISKSTYAGPQSKTPVVYEQVAKKLSKALAFLQKDSSYVGIESRKLSQLKTQAKQNGWIPRDLQLQMIERSELAWSLDKTFTQLANGQTADVRLGGLAISLKLEYLSHEQDGSHQIDRHSTILLTVDKEILLRDLAHPDAAPLTHFINEVTPTKSLHKQTSKIGIPMSNMLYLAHHLITWGKARAIEPLHPRNAYTLSQYAPLDRIIAFNAEYATAFPALPSLAQILKVLSVKPLRWGMLIPSRDHRAPYMEILAFLLRHRFVEQLKTSGWLQAPAVPVMQSPASAFADTDVDEEANRNRRPVSVASLLSPQLRPQADDDVASVSSERTAIPISLSNYTPKLPHSRESKPKNLDVTSAQATSNDHTKFQSIKDPLHPSPDDELRLQYILDEIGDEEIRFRLPSLYRYFNGEEVFEEVAAREGMKRSVFDAWLDKLVVRGFVKMFRWS